MPAPLLPKDEVVRRLFAAFRDNGYEAASLSTLSKATGLGKSSLYHYFPGGKEDMAGAVLDQVERWLDAAAAGALTGPGTPHERLLAMADGLDRLYGGGRNPCLLAGLALGSARLMFGARLRRAFAGWIAALAAVLVEAGMEEAAAAERAHEAVADIQGGLLLAGALDDPASFRRLLYKLPDQLTTEAAAGPAAT